MFSVVGASYLRFRALALLRLSRGLVRGHVVWFDMGVWVCCGELGVGGAIYQFHRNSRSLYMMRVPFILPFLSFLCFACSLLSRLSCMCVRAQILIVPVVVFCLGVVIDAGVYRG